MKQEESNHHFIKIDEEGYPQIGEIRVTDAEVGHEIFSNLGFTDFGSLISKVGAKEVFVEAFDEPLVVKSLTQKSEDEWALHFAYDFEQTLKVEKEKPNLSLDEWDRFHGLTTKGLPFVLSRAAQADFFNQLEDFDDEAIFINNERIEIPDWLKPNEEISDESFWTKIYREETPPWELNEPTPALKEVLPQIKIPRSKILVPGCGSGNDAAHLAENGHIVVGVDFSQEAIDRANEKYGHIEDLSFQRADVFNLGESHTDSFDYIFEHTCYCAIEPERRNELVKTWKKVLRPGGRILGVFFVHPKTHGPPFGGSEWELRKRFNKHGFRSLYWTRWQHSIPRRMGKELVALIELTQ